MYINIYSLRESVGYEILYHILREASALSVLPYRAIPEPRKAGRATSVALTLLFFVTKK